MMAKHNLTLLILGVLSLSLLPGATLAAEPITFNGIGNGQTQNFETNGPWLLDWSVRSDTPLAAKVEMRLLKADSGDFVGRILDLNGIGSGLRLFEEGGRFRITVVASLAEWRIEVTELDKAQADRMKRQSTSGPTFKESIDDALRLVDADSFDGWQTEDNNTLLLLNGDTIRWRVTFRRPCPGLDAATSLSFVTPPAGSLAYYSSILLDDGTRCYFLRVAPYALN